MMPPGNANAFGPSWLRGLAAFVVVRLLEGTGAKTQVPRGALAGRVGAFGGPCESFAQLALACGRDLARQQQMPVERCHRHIADRTVDRAGQDEQHAAGQPRHTPGVTGDRQRHQQQPGADGAAPALLRLHDG
jgi:hypothetical protein